MSFYEEVEIEDMTYDAEQLMYFYPCPCGDKFRITLEELYDGEDVGTCPSCTLRIKIIFDEDTLPELPEFEEEDGDVEVATSAITSEPATGTAQTASMPSDKDISSTPSLLQSEPNVPAHE